MNAPRQRYLVRDLAAPPPPPPPPVPVFCLPYAGGTAALFHRWAGAAPPGVALVPVELPGHGLRGDEAPVTSMHRLARMVADQVRAELAGPYALFGHSLGALLAFETARLLRRSAGEPCALFLSGHNAPSRPLRWRLSHLPDEELVVAANAWGGLPPQLASYPTLRARQLRLLRADLRLAEGYQPAPDEPLRCPLTVFGGRADPLVDRAGLRAWRRETAAATEVVMVPGGHLFIHEDGFTGLLRDHLERLAHRLAAGGGL